MQDISTTQQPLLPHCIHFILSPYNHRSGNSSQCCLFEPRTPYKCNHTVCSLQNLAHFTQNKALDIHTCYCVYRQFVNYFIEQYSIVQMHYKLLIHSAAGLFLLSAIRNGATNILIQVLCRHLFLFILVQTKEWDCWVLCKCIQFHKKLLNSSKVTVQFYILPTIHASFS